MARRFGSTWRRRCCSATLSPAVGMPRWRSVCASPPSEDGNVADHFGPPSGQILLRPTRPGRLALRLTAESAWGQTTVVRNVEVVVPKLRIALLSPAVRAGYPGTEVVFEFRVSGAESLWLIPPGCIEPQRLPDKDGGFLFVTLGVRPAEFRLIARGYGGVESTVLLRAVPQPFACLESD